MQPIGLRLALAMLLPTLCMANARAQSMSAQELERKLQERDKTIIELLERVEVLERRLGVERRNIGSAEPPKRDVLAKGEERLTVNSRRAPGVVVVEEGAAERALERSLTREGALLLPPGVLEIQPSLSYARREDATPGLVTAAANLFAGKTERNVDTLTADLALRLGMAGDTQLELGLPYRRRAVESVTSVGFAPTDSTSHSGAGIGDLRIGLAKTLLREGLWRPDLIGRITWDTNSGRTDANRVFLGGGFHELTGSLTAIKRQDPVAFVGGLSYQHSFENDHVRPGATVSGNFGGFIALNPETSLHLLLSGAYQRKSEVFGRALSGSEQTIGTLVVGGSTLLGRGILFNVGVGIGLTNQADDLSITVSLPIRFGGTRSAQRSDQSTR